MKVLSFCSVTVRMSDVRCHMSFSVSMFNVQFIFTTRPRRRQILLYYLQNNRPIVLLTWQITKWIHQATSGHQPSLILPSPQQRRGKHPANSPVSQTAHIVTFPHTSRRVGRYRNIRSPITTFQLVCMQCCRMNNIHISLHGW